ncbi:very short patch repair endonuclease [Paenibacillus sp. GD4]|uniref:very short patch repair endonuclease n=1 Tax=Paenibacillus sp. GD4 TaxID=3068890 RepID=UPI002796A4E7|nr:very short patch repair endonuclease [Paenibacillus sp. GD4]MDQ1910536.1 very short patch repair endonuclease [Paenibacillus sp. GD4]
MDNLTPEDRRKNMQNIRSTGTKLEERISKALWKRGVRFRKNVKSLPGKPDLSIKKYKLVVFLDSCFFHGCPEHYTVPKTNADYWVPKIDRNRRRDQEINDLYREMGWRVMRFWEHEAKKSLDDVVDSIVKTIEEHKAAKQRKD